MSEGRVSTRIYRVTVSMTHGVGRIYVARAPSAPALAKILHRWHTAKIERIPSRRCAA